ncbi:arrestin [Thelonectria olida]|uniref:Arrestin n=1 Tax=Thelonectria olida TaxID=1576542 RepID=A0A9P8W5E1_9HYPO|nr:arrestin [Thelonectria olida]
MAVQTNWLRSRRHRETVLKLAINHHFKSKIYTTGSTISGTVTITPQHDLPFDAFQISLVGKASTQVDFLRPCASFSNHIFLKLDMPTPRYQLPPSRVFEAGKPYRLRFEFVVPSQLGSAACNHRCSALVQEQHLQLPPTMGHLDGNDQAPETAKIEYAITARIIQRKRSGKESVIETSHPIKVLPVFSEEPPLHIVPDDKRYRLCQAKKMRQGLLSTHNGILRVSAIQPRPVELSVYTLRAAGSPVRLDFEFTSVSANLVPPDAFSIAAKVTSATHFSLAPMKTLTNLGDSKETLPCPVVPYLTTQSIVVDDPGRIFWERKLPSPRYSRRDSGKSGVKDERDDSSSALIENPGIEESSRHSHVATLDIPFTLPTSNKNIFLPTFQSCLISRTYNISITLTMRPSGTAISLSIPLQVTTTKGTIDLPSVSPQQDVSLPKPTR